jgi:hypothetical protein
LTITFPKSSIGNFAKALQLSIKHDSYTRDTIINVKGNRIATPNAILDTNLLNFDTVSSCNEKEITTELINVSCDTEIISFNNSLSEYSILQPAGNDTLLPGDTLKIKIKFFSKVLGRHRGFITVVITPKNFPQSSQDVTLDGFIVQRLPSPQLSLTVVHFDSISVCDSTVRLKTLTLRNPSQCDSMHIDSLWMDGETNLFSGNLSPLSIAPSDSQKISLSFHSGAKGFHNAQVHIRYFDGKSEVDTLISLQAFVYSGKGILSVDAAAFDFGTVSVCDERDTMVTLRNTGCDTLRVSGVGFQGSGFGTDTKFPIIILPHTDTFIHIFTLLDTIGGKTFTSGILTFQSNSDNTLPPIILSRTFIQEIHRDVGLYLDATAKAGGNFNTVTYDIKELPGKTFTKAGIKNLTFDLNYNTDLLTFTQSRSSNVTSSDGKTFTIASPSEIVADGNGLLATVGFTVYLTKDSATTINMANRTDTTSLPCGSMTLSTGGSASFDYNYICGERSLAGYMSGVMPMKITSLHPNPAQDEIELDLQSASKQNAMIEIFDALGVKVFSDVRYIITGSNSIHLDTKGLSGGMYLVRVGGASQSFVKVQ